jgi:hypothetical protein
MKKYILPLLFSLVSFAAFSQKGISYQAIILDPNPIEAPGLDIAGQPLVNGDVWMKFSIYNGSALQFEEIHKTKTDAYGLVSLLIGSVSPTAFNSVVWDANQKNMQVFASFDQGASYTKVSEQKLVYTPYALFSETAGKLGGTLAITGGGTGATSLADARVNLGIDKVDNTPDVAKPVSTATQAALDLKANSAAVAAGLALKANTTDVNTALALKANTADFNSALELKANTTDVMAGLALKANAVDITTALAAKADTGAIKAYVDNRLASGNFTSTQSSSATITDADATTKGKIQLAGDLGGTAAAPTVPGLALKANTADLTSLTNVVSTNTASITSNISDIITLNTNVASNTASITTNLTALNTKAPIASPTFTGIPSAPTAIAGTNTTQLATTEFVTTANAINANLTGDVLSIGNASTVVKINGTSLASLPTGILKNTTSTGIPSVAVAGTDYQTPLVAGTDYLAPNGSAANLTNYPTFNQNTTGNAATATTAGNITATSNTTLTSLSSLNTVGTITSGTWSGTAIAVANGGTGAVNASDAITNLGAEATSNKSTATDLGSTNSSDVLFPTQKAVKTYVDAQTAAAGVSDGSITNIKLAGSIAASKLVGTDITTVGTIATGTWSGTAIAVANGGTGATNAADARTNLGLVIGTNVQAPLVAGTDYLAPNGSAANLTNYPTFNQNTTGNAATATTAGNITATSNTTLTSLSSLNTVGTITSGTWSGTAIAVANGGTGATNAADARTNLGLVIGTNVQAPLVAGTDYLAPNGSAANLTNYPTFNQNTTGNAATATTAGNITATSNTTLTSLSSLNTVGTITSGTWSGTAITVANGGTGLTTLTANNVLLGNGSSALQAVAPGTSGNVLTSDGTTWTSTAPTSAGVPYTGASQAVNLGAYDLTVNGLTVGKGKKDAGTAYQYNTALGVSALNSFTGGTKNTALGYNALSLVTNSEQNIAIGVLAMGSTTADFQQTVAVGNQALNYNRGSFNTALGSNALSSSNLTSTATYLVGVGALALNNNSSGQNNTAVGSYALSANTTGNNNTGLGQGADVTSGTLSNATAIGYNARVSTSNTIQLGNTSVANVQTSGTLTAGDVTYPKTHGTANQVLSTTGSGTLTWTTPSTTATAYSGTLPIANGGTNSTATATSGGIGYGTGTAHAYTAAGSSGQVLISAGAGTPTWATLTAGTAITITNTAGAITIAAAVRPMTEQTTATSTHAVATATFTLSNTPLNSKVWMFINGVRTNNNAYTVSGTSVTYTAANNNSYTIVAGDRIQFDYAY